VARHQLDGVGGVAGRTVLVQAAISALGSCAALSARLDAVTMVAASTRTEDTAPALIDHALFWRSPGFVDAVLDLTGGMGVDVVVDNMGDPSLFETSNAVLAFLGTTWSEPTDGTKDQQHQEKELQR